MLETKDPAIKLFGRKIQLPDDGEALMIHGYDFRTVSEKVEGQYGDFEKVEEGTEMEIEDDDNDMPNKTDDSSNEAERGQEASVNPKTPSIDEEETAKSMNEKSGNEESETSNSEKTLKKPDKLIPCPRCKSMETKFCYFNNYNVNQPRHFCKACQRYWTAGGTMRNVPVGAGRRKSKNSASYYRHITISEALEAARMEGSNRVLNFNLDAVPKCDPCVVNQAENEVLIGLKRVEEKRSLANGKGGESCDNGSRGSSSIPVQSSTDFECHQEESQMQKINYFPSHISCLPGVPWPYMWNPSIPQPQFCPPGFPLSFYPAAAWNCGLPGPWNTPWFSPQVSSPTKSRCSESELSSTLGKHSRDDDINSSKEEAFNPIRNGSVLVPKTLRIDDPSEAAKSSIWATLGIKNESISGGNLFKTFQSSTKGPEKFHVVETSPVLQANPAALSRSLVFHESS